MTVTPELLRRIPMFDGLVDAELNEILGCFSEAKVAVDELLYVEGEVATSACFLVEGELEALKALPGGGAAKVGTITPGAMIGEMALMVGGTRSATVCASTPSTVLTVSRYFFQAALDQLSVPAFKILRAVIRAIANRLDEAQARILEQWDLEAEPIVKVGAAGQALQSLPPSYAYRPFLDVMPWLEEFSGDEIDALLTFGSLCEVPRGEFLYREGSPADVCYLILRGAVERSVLRDRRYQLSILGPGRLSGANALITERAYGCDARVRAQTLLLRLEQQNFEQLFLGDDKVCLKFQNLISANLLTHLRATDNLLALLVSQDYVLRTPRSRSL